MNWQELEKKHLKEWQAFEELRTEAWNILEKNRQAMYAAFGDQEAKIPMSVHERVERDRQEWQALWGKGGMREKYLRTIQYNERQSFKSQTKNSILEQIKRAREKSKIRDKDRERDG